MTFASWTLTAFRASCFSLFRKGTPRELWREWLAPYLNRSFDDPAVRADRAHPGRLRPSRTPVLDELSDETLRAKLEALGAPAPPAPAAHADLVRRVSNALQSHIV